MLIILGLCVAGVFAAKRILDQAQAARAHLVAAMPFAAEAQRALLASDTDAAAAAAHAFAEEAHLAADATGGGAWDIAAGLPLPIFENVRAVDTVADIAVALGDDVLVPASTFALSSLAPSGGRIDVSALSALSAQVDDIAQVVDDARSDLDALDTSALIDQVASGVSDVDGSLRTIDAVVSPAQSVLSVLPEALGATAPKNYLLMFQGNAEARASGGGPGSFILLRAENGALTIMREAAATDFDIALPEPIVALDPETEAVYSDIIGRWIANLTGTPDFPTSAALAQGWWHSEFDDQIDGVISIDPVALSYLLEATGPLALPTGETLTSENAVALLLNEAYFSYPTGVESNVFFAGAASTVFTALTQGSPDPVKLAGALARSGDEGRLKIWTADAAQTDLLGTSSLAGVLPRDNEEENVIGVYFNDTTGSKMDYYVDATIAVGGEECRADSATGWTTTIALTNSVTPEQAADLPGYITGPYYTPGDIATDIIVYSPVGATIESWTVNGAEYPAVSHTTHLGRDVVRIAVVTPPTSTATLEVTMSGTGDATDEAPLTVRHTPMVRDTPVTVDADGCN